MTGNASFFLHHRHHPGRCGAITRTSLMLATVLTLFACAGFEAKEVDVDSYRQRAIVDTEGPITISAAVPDPQETEQLTGLDLYDQGIQPIWLEIKNDSDEMVRVALWSIDRDYFSPIEVAYMNRSGLSSGGEADMQRWFYETRLQRYIAPGETRSGFVYTHATRGTKGFNIDVFGDRKTYNFTFFVPMPGFTADYMIVDFDNLYPEELILHTDPDDVIGLYKGLNDLVICCSTDEKGTRMGEPLNIVFIATGLAVRRSMLRADWHETAANDPSTARAREHHYRGRPPDATFHKYRPDGGERKELRLWLAPGKVGDAYIWLAQVSNNISTAGQKSDAIDYHIDPDVDDARRFTIQNFWYSQSIARFGVTKGASAHGATSIEAPQQNFSGEDYLTDGNRAVLWLSETPVAMDDTVIENLLNIALTPH